MLRSFDLLMQDELEEDEIDWCCFMAAQDVEPRMCASEPTTTDVLGYKWCPAHDYRGMILDEAKGRGWPEVRFQLEGYEQETVQPEGAYYWAIAAMHNSEEYMLEAFAALASIGREKTA